MKRFMVLLLLIRIMLTCMLEVHKKVAENSVRTALNMITVCFDWLEGKKVDYVDAYSNESASKQPQHWMLPNFYKTLLLRLSLEAVTKPL